MSLKFNWPIWGQRAEVEFTNIKDDIDELARLIEMWRWKENIPLTLCEENSIKLIPVLTEKESQVDINILCDGF